MSLKTKQGQDDITLLLDSHPDAMAISDLDGVILGVNAKFATIFRKSKEELIGTSGYDYVKRQQMDVME